MLHAPLESFNLRGTSDVTSRLVQDAQGLAEGFKTEFRWRTESPEWRDAVGSAQRDPRMIIGTSDGGAHLVSLG